MKKMLVIIVTFILLIGTSCNKLNTNDGDNVSDVDLNTGENITINSNIEKPQQDILFVIVYLNVFEENGLRASIIDVNGGYHPLPDSFELNDGEFQDGWYDVLLKAKESEPLSNVKESDLLKMYTFFSEFYSDGEYKMKSYNHTIYDYGHQMLYEVFKNRDGEMDYKKLCSYGENTSCIQSKTAQEFINWMADNKYFSLDDFRY